MRGESGQTLFDGLLVADVSIDVFKIAQFRTKIGRHLQAAFGHQRKQADGLEGNGFAAGVGTGNDEGGEFIAKPQVGGHDLFGINQRMTAADDFDEATRVHFGQACAHGAGQHSLGKGEIQMGEQADIEQNALGMRADTIGQRLQNTGNFQLFLGAQGFEIIA